MKNKLSKYKEKIFYIENNGIKLYNVKQIS